MNILQNIALSLWETVGWYARNRVVHHDYFERTVVRDWRLVRQQALLDINTGEIRWRDINALDD